MRRGVERLPTTLSSPPALAQPNLAPSGHGGPPQRHHPDIRHQYPAPVPEPYQGPGVKSCPTPSPQRTAWPLPAPSQGLPTRALTKTKSFRCVLSFSFSKTMPSLFCTRWDLISCRTGEEWQELGGCWVPAGCWNPPSACFGGPPRWRYPQHEEIPQLPAHH